MMGIIIWQTRTVLKDTEDGLKAFDGYAVVATPYQTPTCLKLRKRVTRETDDEYWECTEKDEMTILPRGRKDYALVTLMKDSLNEHIIKEASILLVYDLVDMYINKPPARNWLAEKAPEFWNQLVDNAMKRRERCVNASMDE
jgi:hypothetical protein